MRPKIRFLSDELIGKIIEEAYNILCTLGIEIHNNTILEMLADCGCKVDIINNHAILMNQIIDKALKTAPKTFKLYDVNGKQTHDFSGDNVYFTPGSLFLNLKYLTEETNNLLMSIRFLWLFFV